MYYISAALNCQCFNAKKYKTLLIFSQIPFLTCCFLFLRTKKAALRHTRRAAFIYYTNYLRTNRMPRVLGPQWLEMVQPARVT